MALLWRATAAARRLPLSRPSPATTTIYGRRSTSSSSTSASTSGTKTTSKSKNFVRMLIPFSVWSGAAAYTAIKVNEKDFVGIREELQKKAGEEDISSLREEMRRLQTSNTILSRCIILLQEEQGSGTGQQQVIVTDDGVLVHDPAPPSPKPLPEVETGRVGGGYLTGSWTQIQKESAIPSEKEPREPR